MSTPSPARGRSFQAAVAIPALFLVMALLPGLPTRGIHLHDEGHFLLGANTVSAGLLGLISGDSPTVLRDRIHATGGTLYFSAKPGYVGLLAVAGLVTGGLTAATAQLLALLSCLVALAALQVMAARRGNFTAILATGLLFVACPLVLKFSGSALGVMPAMACVLAAGACVEVRSRSLPVALLAGALVLLGVLCHYNVAPLALGLGLGLAPCVGPRIRAAAVVGFLGAGLLFQGGTMVADRVLEPVYPDFRSWAGELTHAFSSAQSRSDPQAVALEATIPPERRDGVRGYGRRAWGYLGEMLLVGMGVPLLLALGLGIPAWRREATDRRGDWWLPLMAAGVPLVVWALYPWKVDRALVTAVPGLCLLGGLGFERLAEGWSLPRRRLMAGLAAGVMLAGAVVGGTSRWGLPGPSPYAAAVARYDGWLGSAPGGSVTARSVHWRLGPVWKWYLGPERLNRGLRSPGVDFASRELPWVIVWDAECDLPDANFAGQMEEFRGAIPMPGSMFGRASGGVLMRRPDRPSVLDAPVPTLP
jgi:hypothetical protein